MHGTPEGNDGHLAPVLAYWDSDVGQIDDAYLLHGWSQEVLAEPKAVISSLPFFVRL